MRRRRRSDAQRRAMFASIAARERKKRVVVPAAIAATASAGILGLAAVKRRPRQPPWGTNMQLKHHFMVHRAKQAFRHPPKLSRSDRMRLTVDRVLRRLHEIARRRR